MLQAAELRALLDMHMAKRKQLEILVLQEALFEKRLEAIDESAAKKSKVEGPAARAPVSDDEMLVSAADAADAVVGAARGHPRVRTRRRLARAQECAVEARRGR